MEKDKNNFLNEMVWRLSRPWFFILAAAFIFTPTYKIAQAIESGADFLNIGAGARACAMGTAFTGVSNDINAIYYNPAGLASIGKKEFSLMHANGALGESQDFVSFGFPLSKSVAAISVTRLEHGSFESRDADGRLMGKFGASDMILNLSIAKLLGANSGVGGGVKFISSQISGYNASAIAFDLGFIRRAEKIPLSFGFAVKNIGYGMKFMDEREALPFSINAGFVLNILPMMNINLDVKRLVYDRETFLNIGTEYNLYGGMFLRGGYSNSIISRNAYTSRAITGGFGFNISGFQLDYAITPFDRLGTNKKISLSSRF